MGQTGRQKPQWTHFSMISLDGGWCWSKAGDLVEFGGVLFIVKAGAKAPALQENQMPPTKRPGFRVFFGSSCCLMDFIRGSVSPVFPHVPMEDIPTG